MSKVMIVYWSGTGNTEKMANMIAEGVKTTGKEVEVTEVSKVSAEDLKDLESFALGCPSMGAEVLEESEMEPFVAEVEKFASSKKIGLFGSYGWGDGEWMRDWVERMSTAGAEIVGGEGIITMDEPDSETEEKCKALGKQL